MRRTLLLVLAAVLIAAPAAAFETVQPHVTMCDYCRGGVRGADWDAGSITYGKVCAGLYGWSKYFGGTDADDVGSWSTALNTDGNGEWGTCLGDGYGELDDGTAISPVESCLHAGERFKLHATADAMIAQEMARPNPGECVVYFCTADDSDGALHNQTLYEIDGCGARRDGVTPTGRGDATNPCPVLRSPKDTHPHRVLQQMEGKRWCLEGTDPDGLFEPLTAAADERQTGVILVNNTGSRGGCTSGNCAYDLNGDNTSALMGALSIGGRMSHANECIPVSATDPRCDTAARITVNSTSMNLFGALSELTDDTAKPLICIDDDPTAGESGGATCSGARRIACTTGSTYCTASTVPWACCTGSGTGTCDTRATATTGGCDFGAGGDLGNCEGMGTAIDTEMLKGTYSSGQDRRLKLVIEARPCDLDGDDCVGGNSVTYPTVSAVDTGACGTREKRLRFGVDPSLGGSNVTFWPLRSPGLGGSNDVGVVDDRIHNNTGGGVFGGTIRSGSWMGRVAGDTEDSGTANDGVHTTTRIYVAAATFTANEHNGKTLILRDDQQFEHEGCSSSCKEAMEITDTGTNYIDVASAFDDAPAEDDSFRVSAASCTNVNVTSTTGEDACDQGDMIMIYQTWNGKLAYMNMYRTGQINDGGGGSDNFEMHDIYVKNHHIGFLSDMSEVNLHDSIFENLYNPTSTLFRVSFGGPTTMTDLTLRNIAAASVFSEGYAQKASFRNISFEGVAAGVALFTVSQASLTTIDGITVNGARGAVVQVQPGTDATVAGLTIKNVKVTGYQSVPTSSVQPVAVINFSSNSEGNLGDIEQITIENVYAIADPDVTGVIAPMLVGFEHPDTSASVMADHYDQIKIINSGIRRTVRNEKCTANLTPWLCCTGSGTGTCVKPKIACTYDSDGGLGNEGCEDAGTYDATTLESPPFMLGNSINGLPAGDFAYGCVPAASLAHLDSDDYGAGVKVCISQDHATPCNDTDGVLDGGAAGRNVCGTDGEGNWVDSHF